MNKKQLALILLYVGFHFVVVAFCLFFSDPFGVMILFFGIPAAAASSTMIVAGLCRFWRGKRRGQLPLILLVILMLYSEIVARELYGYYWFEWLPTYFPMVVVQYGCCLLTAHSVRRKFDRIATDT